ncbi:MAG: pyridoxamine kinase [Firmicutes bacterium]|nr:pyridoxamine kinase [Bacillota bacterium]
MKRIISVQDLSCVGKCSLTVALPIISAMGVEVSVLPTAVLSCHTAFDDFSVKDLTGEIKPIGDKLKKQGISFDAIYTGYLSSEKQAEEVLGFFDKFKNDDCIVFCDPAMADNGKLYTGFENDFIGEMAKVCAKADIIVPNLTEACFLLGKEYNDGEYKREEIKKMLGQLCEIGCKTAAVTGISYEEGKVGVAVFQSEINDYFEFFTEKIGSVYHGTGDVFSSCCVGAIMNGFSIPKAFEIAVKYTAQCVKASFENKDRRWYGVDFETAIPMLLKMIGKV